MSLEYPSRACLHPFTDKHSSAVMAPCFLGATELGQCHCTELGRLTAESRLEQESLPLPVVCVGMASCKRTACTSSKQTTLIFQLGLGLTFTEGDYKPREGVTQLHLNKCHLFPGEILTLMTPRSSQF